MPTRDLGDLVRTAARAESALYGFAGCYVVRSAPLREHEANETANQKKNDSAGGWAFKAAEFGNGRRNAR